MSTLNETQTRILVDSVKSLGRLPNKDESKVLIELATMHGQESPKYKLKNKDKHVSNPNIKKWPKLKVALYVAFWGSVFSTIFFSLLQLLIG